VLHTRVEDSASPQPECVLKPQALPGLQHLRLQRMMHLQQSKWQSWLFETDCKLRKQRKPMGRRPRREGAEGNWEPHPSRRPSLCLPSAAAGLRRAADGAPGAKTRSHPPGSPKLMTVRVRDCKEEPARWLFPVQRRRSASLKDPHQSQEKMKPPATERDTGRFLFSWGRSKGKPVAASGAAQSKGCKCTRKRRIAHASCSTEVTLARSSITSGCSTRKRRPLTTSSPPYRAR
jgi:hypothetical protein